MPTTARETLPDLLTPETVDDLVRASSRGRTELAKAVGHLIDEAFMHGLGVAAREEATSQAAAARQERQEYVLGDLRQRAAHKGTTVQDLDERTGQAWATEASRRWSAMHPDRAALLRPPPRRRRGEG